VRNWSYIILAAIAFFAIVSMSPHVHADDRQIVGYIEDVRIFPGDVLFRAKVDTGAKTSSIDVRDLTKFERDNAEWVRFTITNKKSRSVTFERPIFRNSKVRRSGTEKQVRYVVRLGVCLDGYFKEAEVNLNDRAGMSYRMLIGRGFLADRFLVDPLAKNLTTPDCRETPGK